MFELTQTSDVSQWKGDPQDKAWQAYLAAVRRFFGQDGPGYGFTHDTTDNPTAGNGSGVIRNN